MTGAPTSLLVPFDGTDGARRALRLADDYATGAELPIDLLVVGSAGLEDQDRIDLQDAASHLHAAVGELLVVAGDDVAGAISECVAEREGAMAWMATHGRSRLGGLVLGGTAEAVVREARRPMVLVGPEVGGGRFDGPIVVGVERFSPPPALLTAARWWAERLRCPLRLVTVSGADDLGDGDDRARLDAVVALPALDGIDVETAVLAGDDPAAVLASYADHEGAPLLAAATHARAGIRRAVLGSVTSALVRRAPCPVLVEAAAG